MRQLAVALGLALPGLAQAQVCDAFPNDVRFCPGDTGFTADAGNPSEGRAAYLAGETGLSIEVAPLSVNADTDPARIRPILNGYLAEARGLDSLRVAYAATGRDDSLVADTVVLGEGYAVYVQTFGTGPDFTEDHRALHDAALAQIDLPEAPE